VSTVLAVVAEAATGAASEPSYGWFLVETLVVLGAVCALAWFGLRWLSRRAFALGGKGPIKVLARAALEPRRTLYVVEVGGKTLLIGAGEGPLATLAELDGREVRAAVAREAVRPGGGFLAVLRGSKGTAEPSPSTSTSTSTKPSTSTSTKPDADTGTGGKE